MTSEQRPPVNNGHNIWVPRLVVVHKFDYISQKLILLVGEPTKVSSQNASQYTNQNKKKCVKMVY
jgi:hypothetical protein